MLFLSLICSVSSVRRDKYTTCAQSKFCSRDRNVEAQKWAINPESVKSSENAFLAVIDDATYRTQLTLKVSFFENGAVRFRVDPAEKEDFCRFDTSLEPTIVDQKQIQAKRNFEISRKTDNCELKTKSQTVVINYKPFFIAVKDTKGEAILLNFNDQAVFETRRSKEKYPTLFESSNFNGFNDIYKNGPTSVAMSFRILGKENRITGLPAHTLPMSLADTVDVDPLRFYNTDINEFEVGNGMSMYGAVPFMLSHSLERSVGLFWANPSETWVDIKHAEDKSMSDVRFMSEGGFIDVYIFTGDHKAIIDSYTQLTGRPMLMPRFALGYHQCRWGYLTQEDFMQVSKSLDDIGVPHDVMWLDLDHADDKKYFTFHPSNFPSPKKMLTEFAKSKRYVVTLVDPHLKAERSYNIYASAMDRKLFMKNRDGSIYEANCWPGKSSWPDYMNPAARQWWESLFEFSSYADSAPNLYIWNDMNEISVFDASDNSSPRDLVHYGDIEEREIHNIYGHMMVSSTFGGLRKRTSLPMRPFILTRSFFAGSQKYCAAWSGDNTADWNHLRNSIQLVLSFGLGGMVYSGSDVGGFFNSPNDKLLSRWFSVAAWTYTFFREHCHHNSNRREISVIQNQEAQKLMKDSVVERYSMLPYWYTLSKEANETGSPIVRPMWWEFEGSQFLDIDNQVMLGSSLLIVPFIEEEEKDRQFKLPQGNWYNFRTLAKHTDSTAKYEFGETLVLIRGGSIIPKKCRIRKSSELMFFDPFTLIIAADEKGQAKGTLYEDDGKSEEFEAGNFIYRQFSLSNGKLTNSPLEGKEKPRNQFSLYYEVEIERICISGIEKPTKITGPNGELTFEYEGGVLTIRKPSLAVRDIWEISIA